MSKHGFRGRTLAGGFALLVLISACTSSNPDQPGTTGMTANVSVTASVPDVSGPSPSQSADSATSAPSNTTPSVVDVPTPSSLDPAAQEAADRAAVETQWVEFWRVYESIVRTPPSSRAAALETVSVEPLRTRILNAASNFDSQGLDYYGTVIQHPYWIDPINGAQFATMRDCQDQSSYGSIYVASGKKRTVGVERNSLQAGFVRGSDAVWRVQSLQYLENVPC